MLSRTRRRLAGVAVATLVASVTTIAGASSPAQAFNWGQLYAKGTGGIYAKADKVMLGVVPGAGAATWSYKIVNPGPATQPFKLVLDDVAAGLTASLFVNGKAVASPYTTPSLAPGASQVVSLRMSLDAGVPQYAYPARVTLVNPEYEWALAESHAIADATYQTGTTSHDLFLKTGTQPFVGGSAVQYETASTLRTGSSVAFVLRAQNDGRTPAHIRVQLYQAGYYCPDDFAVIVRQGLTNVTRAVESGSYNVLLAPGARKDLTMTVKETAAHPCGGEDFFALRATGPDGEIQQYAHVIVVQ
jgi:hypothetical protein